MLLRRSLFDTPDEIETHAKTLFHEAAHSLIYALGINYAGDPGDPERGGWANISGIGSYRQYCEEPQKPALRDGFLTQYGWTMPDEDLAEWVGITYDLLVKGEGFSDLLRQDSRLYDPLYKQKIDFLLRKGFITTATYEGVTSPRKNTKAYLYYNE